MVRAISQSRMRNILPKARSLPYRSYSLRLVTCRFIQTRFHAQTYTRYFVEQVQGMSSPGDSTGPDIGFCTRADTRLYHSRVQSDRISGELVVRPRRICNSWLLLFSKTVRVPSALSNFVFIPASYFSSTSTDTRPRQREDLCSTTRRPTR
jgi:hypothetical protein